MTILEERGLFWWSDSPIADRKVIPDLSVAGLLKITDDGRITLELDGALENAKNPQSLFDQNSVVRSKHIIGELKRTKNKHVLLQGIYYNGGGHSSTGYAYQNYLALECLVGDRIFPRRIELSGFSSFEVDLVGFEEWLELKSIEITSNRASFSAKYKKQRDIVYGLHNGKIVIRYDIYAPWYPLGKRRRDSLTLKESVSLIYTHDVAMTLEDIQVQYRLLEDILILLTDSEYCLDWPCVGLAKRGTVKCRLYFMRTVSKSTSPSYHECWTKFGQIRQDFGRIYSAWLKKREIFGPGFYLYLGTRRGMTLYTEHRFVSLIWGLESFHRIKHPDYPKNVKLRTKIQRIIEQVTQTKDKKWLEGQLAHADEPSLEQRISETISSLPLELDENRIRKFAKDCAHARNDISHYGGQRQSGIYSEFLRDLNIKNDALSCLYHALLLQEIEIDGKMIKWWVYDGFKSYGIKKMLVDVGLLDPSALA